MANPSGLSRRQQALKTLELPVNSDPTLEELKKQYRALALKYHPDRNNGDDRQFKEISIAYEALTEIGQRGPIDPDLVADIIFGPMDIPRSRFDDEIEWNIVFGTNRGFPIKSKPTKSKRSRKPTGNKRIHPTKPPFDLIIEDDLIEKEKK